MGLPKNRKPTAEEVAAWAISMIGKRVDVDGQKGAQCWDTPNYIFKRYWGFFTPGNAIAMGWDKLPKGFKRFTYHEGDSFIPKPGDIAVWGRGNYNNGIGHTAIVVGPSDRKHFTSVDQNWYNSNGWTGSPGAKIPHTYYGISCFIRPPYHSSKNEENKDDKVDVKTTAKDDKPKYKNVTKVSYTSFSDNLDRELEYIDHFVAHGKRREKTKGIYIKECPFMRSVQELYKQRDEYVTDDEYPHVYVDRERIWHPRPTELEAPQHPGWIVIEVCGGATDTKRQFLLNQIRAMIHGIALCGWNDVKISKDSLKVDKNIWRTLKDVIDYDLIVNGIPEPAKYEEVEKKLLEIFAERKTLMTEIVTTSTVKTQIKLRKSDKTSDMREDVIDNKKLDPKITIAKSSYTFTQALNMQMAHGKTYYSVGMG